MITGKRILVTGAGGTIGGEIVRQLWRHEPAQVVLLGHGENSIFARWQEAREQGHEPIPVIADIRDESRLLSIFAYYRPQLVFHAAAHKHVPLMETNPIEAVSNNVLGTRTLLRACQTHQVDRFVLVSTDKAVYPISVMGVTKRIAELLALQASCTVIRLGNVWGSTGSAILTFQRQIAAGGPVTITDPNMTRYFMYPEQAAELALEAMNMGVGGDIFLCDMGPARKLIDVVEDLIMLNGKGRPDILCTGPRPGEKMQEDLIWPGELRCHTSHPRIYRLKQCGDFIPETMDTLMDVLSDAVLDQDVGAALDVLKMIVPDYQPSEYLERLPA